MEGKPSNFYPNEIEALFHFDQHYTDYGLSNTERYKLLGLSWDVDSIISFAIAIIYFYRRRS